MLSDTFVVFFFSSRRRHTRLQGDWSSDVCSSDLNTPYVNSVAAQQQPVFPGDLAIEERLASIMRWNALAMVVRANQAYRSEERRVGEEGRSRWAADHLKKKKAE